MSARVTGAATTSRAVNGSSHRYARLAGAVVVAYASGGWLVYRRFGHRVIEALYRGEGPAFLNSIIESQSSQPLSFYFDLADRQFILLHTLLVWLGVLVWASLRFNVLVFSALSQRARAGAASFAAFAIAPLGALKAALFVPVALATAPRSRVVLPRLRVMLALLSVFGFAFLVAPYWMLPALPLSPVVAAALIAAVGMWWAYLASGEVVVEPIRLPPLVATAITGVLLAIAWPALTADIPWRGDEGYHIDVVLNACQHVAWFVVAILACSVVRFADTASRRAVAIVIVAFTMTFALTGRLYDDQFDPMTRYPFFSRWVQATPMQALVWSYRWLHDETALRVIPLLSWVGLAWAVCESSVAGRPVSVAPFLFAVAVATTPIVIASGTLLYLEPPAVLLATLVAFDATELLTSDPRAMRSRVSWLALLMLGFIKETTLPFLAAFVACRLAVRLRLQRSWRTLASEALVALVVLVPLAMYLVLVRYGSGLQRGHAIAIGNLGSWHLYPALVASWLEQMGVVFVLFLAGSISHLRRAEWAPVAFWWTTAVFVSVFHITDRAEFVGLSRFNLFIVPGAIAAATMFARRVVFPSRALTVTVLAAALAVNIAFRPFHLDGSRVRGWGAPPMAPVEETYPYSTTIEYVARTHPTATVLFTGMTFDYPFEFYLKRVGWRSPYVRRGLNPLDPHRAETLQRIVRLATVDERVTVIILHPLAGEPLARFDGYELERVFETSTNRLAFYSQTTGR